MKLEIIRVLKKFTFRGMEFRIVKAKVPYMNSGEGVVVRKVLAPNDREIPVTFNRNDTLKAIQQNTINALFTFESLGADIKEECTKI